MDTGYIILASGQNEYSIVLVDAFAKQEIAQLAQLAEQESLITRLKVLTTDDLAKRIIVIPKRNMERLADEATTCWRGLFGNECYGYR
ncbi:hypothetical protein DSO57_1001781 [Entomophthora muscae]|uniref:Uncharacterized protein n=1 Tax=Entomophthora muscae TaxID=34485 RepID=A0ACC2T8W2_9FUNG|nr:hypothetical protein DSO57_1001781 [Entomophthora muscae]